MTLESDIIFLDTSVFERDNFFRGHKIKRLGELGHDGQIEIKLTQVTYDEVKNRIRKRLQESKSLFRKFSKTLDSDARILKNLAEYDDFFPFKNIIVQNEYDKLVSKFDEWIAESNVEIVPTLFAKIDEVLGQYWNQEAPFGEGQKKDEFPDALSLNSVHNWAKEKGKKVYVLSTDSDFYNCATDDNLTMIKDIAIYLSAVNTKIEGERFIDSIENQIINHFESIEMSLKETYSEDIVNLVYQSLEGDFEDLEYEEPTISDIKLIRNVVLEASQNLGAGQITLQLLMELPIIYRNYDFAFYDKEDDTWYGVETEFKNLQLHVILDFNIEFEYEIDEGEFIYFEITNLNDFDLIDYHQTKDDGDYTIDYLLK